MLNSVIETVLSRSSIRAYADRPIEEAKLAELKKAALASPTAMNRQDQRFLFVTNREAIDKIDEAVIEGIIASGNAAFAERIRSRGGKTIYNAPLFVGIFAKPARFSAVDAGIAVQDLALGAKSLGLDSVILGMPDAAFSGEKGHAFAASLGVPEGFEFMIGIAIGYKATEKEPHEWDESHIIEVK